MNKEEIEELAVVLEQKGNRICEIRTQTRALYAEMNHLYDAEIIRQGDFNPGYAYGLTEAVAREALRTEGHHYCELQKEVNGLEDESLRLTVALERGRSQILLELIERSAEAFPLSLLTTKLGFD